jgi:uncharacterized protein YsxB (DUF464 family)
MTEVRYTIEGGMCELKCDGHATGDPAVCAAVSALTQTLLGWLLNLRQNNAAEIMEQECKEGYFHVHAFGGAGVNMAFSMIAFGLEQLAHSFPQQISVKK